MALDIETPLSENTIHPTVGGSAGSGTHGGTAVPKPDGMPAPDEADYHVTNWRELEEGLTDDNALVYTAANINATGKDTIHVADGVTLYSDYCNPDIDGIGGFIYHNETDDDTYPRQLLQHAYGKPMQIYGVYFLGPKPRYFDPDHTSDEFGDLITSAVFEYADKNDGLFKVVGCRFTGWTCAGIRVGAKNYETDFEIHRSTFERNYMEHLGYGISQLNGNGWVDRCFFDTSRHAIAGFGYPTEFLDVTESVFGPGPYAGHIVDRHCLANNLPTDDRTAGGHLRIRNCTFLGETDIAGYGQEAVAIRGISDEESRIYNCEFVHDHPADPPGEQGSPVRQEVDGDEWVNLRLWNNTYGEIGETPGIGAPRADTEPKPDPRPQTHRLSVTGPGAWAHYEIVVRGDVSLDASAEQSEAIDDLGGNRRRLSGAVVGGTDTFILDHDASIEQVWCDRRVLVELDGQQIVTGTMVAAAADQRLTALEQRIEQVAGEIDPETLQTLRDRLSVLEGRWSALEAIFN